MPAILRLALPLLLALLALPAAAAPRAKFVSQVIPETVTAGERFAVVVQYRNEGRAPWPRSVRLRQVGARIWGRVNAPAEGRGPVGPGELATFRITLTAPRQPGRHRLRWRLSNGGRLFGPPTPAVEVTVQAAAKGPAWDAEFVHQTLPGLQEGDPPFALLQTGRAYPVTVVFKNTGRQAWRGGAVRLVPVGEPVPGLWSVAALEIPAGETVAPGKFHAFRFTLLAPLEPGIYPFQWRLERHGRPFGDASPKVSVTVR